VEEVYPNLRKANREHSTTNDLQSIGREAASKRRLSKSGQLIGITDDQDLKVRGKSRISFERWDKISIGIVKELLNNPNVKSADIASKLRIPLSTIQRRRASLETSSILRKAYELDLSRLGWREAELLITVQKGRCRAIAQQLLTKFKNNVKSATLRIGDPEINVAADIIYKSSPELLNIIEVVKNMEFVSYVEWSEITEVVGTNNIDMQSLLNNSAYSGGSVTR
jgi:DNA-binding Lrp family transcriptional regulator